MINNKTFSQKYSLLFSVADFPAGNVSVTVYNNGVPLSKAQLQYYSNMEEITCLLARAADPVEFMCQVIITCPSPMMMSSGLVWVCFSLSKTVCFRLHREGRKKN